MAGVVNAHRGQDLLTSIRILLLLRGFDFIRLLPLCFDLVVVSTCEGDLGSRQVYPFVRAYAVPGESDVMMTYDSR